MNIDEYPVERGRYLIEASAGTGKTWTITHLFLRLVLRGVPVGRILVTTFSKAAAAELKERIQNVLREELAAREAPGTDAENPAALREKLLLRLAADSLDEIFIGTIHGFCQKMLHEFPLETGISEDAVLVPDDAQYREFLVRSFCRERYYRSDIPAGERIQFGNLCRAAAMAPHNPGEVEVRTDEETRIYQDVLEFVQANLQREKERESVLSFDDLIVRFHAALTAPGSRLGDRVRSRFQAVFVDEFQDTDRLQFEIFDRCFPKESDALFYMIGDPKQAIYEFRGADIYTYLHARDTADACYHLTRNFRSTPRMIEAVNRMFGDGDPSEGHTTAGAFLQEDIPYIAVVSGKGEEAFPSQRGVADPTLRFRHYVGKTKECDNAIFEDVTREIAWLLSPGNPMKIDREIEENGVKKTVSAPLQASDIAILVPKHDQAARFLKMLNSRNIAASACKSGRIFESVEARVMLFYLEALLDPAEERLRALLLSPLFRVSGQELLEEQIDMSFVREQLRIQAEAWRESGLPSAFYALLDMALPGRGAPRRNILAEAGGERRYTNLMQLMELLYDRESREHLQPDEVVSLLRRAIAGESGTAGDASADGGVEDNPEQLRLDRDGEAVQILTMFAAKGLEFPVVFVPFPARTAGSRIVYGTLANRGWKEGRPQLDFTKKDEELAAFTYAEALRSQLRLLYVALTRASYVTYLYTRQLPDNDRRGTNFVNSAQGVLMTDRAALRELSPASFYNSKATLPEVPASWFTHPEGVFGRWPERPALTLAASGETRDDLVCRTPPTVPEGMRTMSFSSFHSILEHTREQESETAGEYDTLFPSPTRDAAEEAAEPGAPASAVPGGSFRDFPRGTRVGTMVHEALEALGGGFDLFAPDAPEEKLERARNIARRKLAEYGCDPERLLEPFLDGMVRALRTPLPGLGCALYEIRNYVQEMDFLMDASRSLALGSILHILNTQASEPYRGKLGEVPDSVTARGFLTGKIDLIFEHKGLYYIADWKTNDLGRHDEDYAPEAIREAMVRSHYILQGYLYSAGLLQLLRQRWIAEERFGGVYYLFLRGMDAAGCNGIWFDRPGIGCLDALLKLMRKEASL